MRILVMTRSLPFHQIGGMEAVAWDVAQGLVGKGCTVRILTTSCETLPALSEHCGITIQCLPTASGRYSKGWWTESRQVYEDQLAAETDIVLSVSAAALSAARGRQVNTPPHFVVQAHGTAWGEVVSKLKTGDPRAWARSLYNIKSMWTDLGYRNFDSFVAVGDKVQVDLAMPPTKWITGDMPIHLIRNGIKPDLFRFDAAKRAEVRARFGWTDTSRLVVSSSRLIAEKGLTESVAGFVSAAKRDPSLRYLILGSGAQEGLLKRMVQMQDIDEAVKFCGHVPREELSSYLSAADVFLFTTLRMEGLPLNILEALAAGLPCIVSNHVKGPLLETIGVEPRDRASVAKAILDATARGGSSRKSRLPACYTLDHAVGQYVALFEDLMKGVAA